MTSFSRVPIGNMHTLVYMLQAPKLESRKEREIDPNAYAAVLESK